MGIQILNENNGPWADSLMGIYSWQNSEHWWTALFSLLLLHLASHNIQKTIPARILKYRKGKKYCFETVSSFDYAGLDLSNMAIESKLKNGVAEALFKDLSSPKDFNWPKDFSSMEPDITIREPKQKRVRFIEVKAVRGKAGRLEKYLELRDHLRKQPHWKTVEMIVLISFGNPQPDIWQTILNSKGQLQVILWEDVLRVLDDIETFRSFFTCDLVLADYYRHVPLCAL